MKSRNLFLLLALLFIAAPAFGQKKKKKKAATTTVSSEFDAKQFEALKFRNIGPFRGGRSNAVSGVVGDPMTYYMGTVGGGMWKTEDAGISWNNISDGFFKTASVGAVAVSESDPNVIYVGMGEHAPRGVMTSSGDGVYRSTDAGRTWTHLGLKKTRHISRIRIHPSNPDIAYVAAQGTIYGPNPERGIYKTMDGGKNWKLIHHVDDKTGAADLSMDMTNPRILYASMWDYQRFPWTVRSGGPGSGVWKSTDSGETWKKLEGGLPKEMGKVAVDVSRANPDIVYANIEAELDKSGVYKSTDAGKTWKLVCKDRITVARAWYYIEIYADPMDENIVYVMNAPYLKSVDGGKTFESIRVPHGDQHDMWINPHNNKNIINANDGGSNISFNDGKSWSQQSNQPTAQFYRVIADNQFPYHIYGGQQDNSCIAIASRTNSGAIGWKDWYSVAGGESAFVAFDNPDNPQRVYGGSYQGNISVWDATTKSRKDIMAYPVMGLGTLPKNQKYRFTWNAPIVTSPQDRRVIYHAGNKVLKSSNGGLSWMEISPDLTRNDTTKHGVGGGPYTNEGAGGENYNTITYLAASPHSADVLWVGSDDGLVHITRNGGKDWTKITPPGLTECLINAIDVSVHQPGTAYVVATRYRQNDLSPNAYKTSDYGNTWTKIINGIDSDGFIRVIRADQKVKGLLYAGTETGLYVSFNDGMKWERFQSNLPITTINDMTIADNDLVVATAGRSFWILDDLSSLQQSKGKLDKSRDIVVYQPKDAYRFAPGAGRKIPGYGQNPDGGVTIDYAINEKPDSNAITMNIFDTNGSLVKKYSSAKDDEDKKRKLLPKKEGLNRFTWDLTTPNLQNIPGLNVFEDTNGHTVAPGTYTIQVIMNGDTSSTTAVVKPDPRIKATPQDYEEQALILSQITDVFDDIHSNVNRMRDAKTQVEAVNKALENIDDVEALIEKGKAVAKSILNWEENLVQSKQKTFQDVINFENQINIELANLKSRVDQAEPHVTAGAKERLVDLSNTWAEYRKELDRIINEEVGEFNQMYKDKNLPVLILQKDKKKGADKP